MSTSSITEQSVMTSPLSYDTFVVGARIGSNTLVFDLEQMQLWQQLYGEAPASRHVPMGAAPLLLMQAFATIVVPRPPGNLHVGQTCTVKRMPDIGKSMSATVDCLHKEKKGERKLVAFATHITDPESGDTLISGVTKVFWTL